MHWNGVLCDCQIHRCAIKFFIAKNFYVGIFQAKRAIFLLAVCLYDKNKHKKLRAKKRTPLKPWITIGENDFPFFQWAGSWQKVHWSISIRYRFIQYDADSLERKTRIHFYIGKMEGILSGGKANPLLVVLITYNSRLAFISYSNSKEWWRRVTISDSFFCVRNVSIFFNNIMLRI